MASLGRGSGSACMETRAVSATTWLPTKVPLALVARRAGEEETTKRSCCGTCGLADRSSQSAASARAAAQRTGR
eukprot:CAMPEP_0175281398 /NCGR_PEP_ID=MMETSP0093-20121207/51081_1 /TAXON_ID=311494 /ORGANISM="Alexandrium monilatum, Strain CCMP3105" /LENGTH=73 /DNA_ID=CAMNT_0016576539 /DNA_START=84 /DNA_END=301 /DNA_ORIENTATION=+